MQKLWPSCRLVGVARSNCLPVLPVRMPAALCRCCSLSSTVRGQLVIRCVSIHLVVSVNQHRLLLCRALINRRTSVLRFRRWIRMLVIAKLEHVSDNRFVSKNQLFLFRYVQRQTLLTSFPVHRCATLLLRKYEPWSSRRWQEKCTLFMAISVLYGFTRFHASRDSRDLVRN